MKENGRRTSKFLTLTTAAERAAFLVVILNIDFMRSSTKYLFCFSHRIRTVFKLGADINLPFRHRLVFFILFFCQCYLQPCPIRPLHTDCLIHFKEHHFQIFSWLRLTTHGNVFPEIQVWMLSLSCPLRGSVISGSIFSSGLNWRTSYL